MHRRESLLRLVALCATLGTTLGALAQPARKRPRIGVLFLASAASVGTNVEAFRAGLQEYGYVEGRTVDIEFRSAEGHAERLPALAKDLVARKVDVIIAGGGNVSTLAARKATSTIPIIMSGSFDAVAAGLVASLARPGGNVTGLNVPADLAGKQLELMRELLPGLAKVAVLTRADEAVAGRREQAKAMIKDLLQLDLDFVAVREAEDLAAALNGIRAAKPGALMVGPDPLYFQHAERLIEFARSARIPAIYPLRDFVEAGGLLSYSVSSQEFYRGIARYLDRILKGAKPADLPVEEPRAYELVINLKTAKTLGIAVPQTLLLRADRVIE